MKTITGKECRFYYEDFNRGRSKQECRLILPRRGPTGWRPSDCKKCSAPNILWANASENLELRAVVENGFLGIGRHVAVRARCRKHEVEVPDPYSGCSRCAAEHPRVTDIFR